MHTAFGSAQPRRDLVTRDFEAMDLVLSDDQRRELRAGGGTTAHGASPALKRSLSTGLARERIEATSLALDQERRDWRQILSSSGSGSFDDDTATSTSSAIASLYSGVSGEYAILYSFLSRLTVTELPSSFILQSTNTRRTSKSFCS